MKKFAFSLQRILGFKRTLYEKERNTLAQLRVERAVLQYQRDDTERQMLQKDAEFREKAAGEGVGISEVTSIAFHRDNADKMIKQLEVEIEQKDIEIEAQLQIVIELDKEVKSLEKLRESQWDEYVADYNRAENERILEIVSGQFAGEQREAAAEEAEEYRRRTANQYLA